MKWIATSSTAPWYEKVPQPTEAAPQLSVTDRRQQAIDGFGGCFNEIGWQALEALSEDRRAQVLRDLFDPATGCGYRLYHVPVGANDYALEWYSHNECDGDLAMKHFSIARDQRYLIPYVYALPCQYSRTYVHDSIDNQEGELLCIHTIALRRRT